MYAERRYVIPDDSSIVLVRTSESPGVVGNQLNKWHFCLRKKKANLRHIQAQEQAKCIPRSTESSRCAISVLNLLPLPVADSPASDVERKTVNPGTQRKADIGTPRVQRVRIRVADHMMRDDPLGRHSRGIGLSAIGG